MTPTAIEWTEETWNPVTGCTKVSAGCDNCYAERITERFHGKGSFEKVELHPDRLDQPMRRRKPTMWFVNSMSDLFHADVPKEFIAEVFAVMALVTAHTFQVLTKRPGRMRSLLTDDGFRRLVEDAIVERNGFRLHDEAKPWPLPNVWLGISCEDQETARKRIPVLGETPAAVRFLSCEPLLDHIDIAEAYASFEYQGAFTCADLDRRGIHWVIVGGESGLQARPMQLEWARSLRDQCAASHVPFFFKQWGGRTPKANGRELDGRTWDEMPAVSQTHDGSQA